MLYGFTSGLTTVVAAAPTIADLESFYQKFSDLEGTPEGFVEQRASTFLDHLQDDLYQGFKHSVYIFEHADATQQQCFVEQHGILLKTRNFCVGRHADMMQAEPADDGFDPNDNRTIAEIHGLTDEDDKWDRRTPEQKARDADIKEKVKKLKEAGEMSGDSFAPVQNQNKEGVRVTDIRGHENADGSITLDNVLAVKHSGEKDEEEEARRAAEKAAKLAEELAKPRPWHDGSLVDMPEEERAKLPEQYEGEEFLFGTVPVDRKGTYVTITPKTHWDKHGVPYDAAPLSIDRLLPPGYEEVSNGVYLTKTMDRLTILNELTHRGFKESWLVQVYLNNQ